MERYEKITDFWFGDIEHTIVPSEDQARLWFGEDPKVDHYIADEFGDDLEKAKAGEYNDWIQHPRGQLGMILLLDQFSRHIYRSNPKSYQQDSQALKICMAGLEHENEHDLSLIERVFYYFPMIHAESLITQTQSLSAYQLLAELSFSETRILYDSFLKFANHHYTIIEQFGRFPQRNAILGRKSTLEEQQYLDELAEEDRQD